MTSPSEGCERRELGEAIRLRLLVHRALDRDDLASVAESNRKADDAYLRLSPTDARVYIEWARQFIPSVNDLVLVGGGDS